MGTNNAYQSTICTIGWIFRDWIRRAIEHRYRLIPYLHTIMYEAAETGAPPIRPIFFEFPDEQVGGGRSHTLISHIFKRKKKEKKPLFSFQATFNISEQFMMGDALLFSPVVDVLSSGQFPAYFPYGSW